MSDEGIDRRTALKGVGAAGVAITLAGCVGGESEEGSGGDGGDSDSEGSQSNLPPRPTPPQTPPDNEYWQFVVDSLDYQNAVLEDQQ